MQSFLNSDGPLALVGPVLKVGNGYAFDTWTETQGLLSCAPYRRLDDARYGRTATMRHIGRHAVDCATRDEFVALVERRSLQ